MSLPVLVLVWRDGAEALPWNMVKLMPRRGYIPVVTQGLAASHPSLGYCCSLRPAPITGTALNPSSAAAALLLLVYSDFIALGGYKTNVTVLP